MEAGRQSNLFKFRKEPPSVDKKGIALIFLTALISGFAIFINKFGVAVVSPDVFTTLKNTTVAFMLLASLFYFDRGKLASLTRKNWLSLLAIGAIGGSVPFILFFRGLAIATAATAAFIHKTMFLYVAVLAAFFLKEKISRKLLAAAGLLLAGNALFLKFTPAELTIGTVMVLAATLLWAGEAVLSKKVLKKLDSSTVAFGRMFFGSLFLLAYLIATSQAPAILTLNQSQLGWVAVTALFLLAYVTTWYSGLKRVSASTAACILSLGAPITTGLKVLAGAALPSPVQAFGVLLILAGVSFAILHEVTCREAARVAG